MGFQIDKKSIEEIKKKVKREIGTGISPKTKSILSQVESQMYLSGSGLSEEEFEKNMVARFNLVQSEYNYRVKIPIEGFFKAMESYKLFLNSISEGCYLLEQLPEASEITKQDLLDLDNKVKKEGRGINKIQLQNVMTNFGVIVSQERIIFDKINNLPKTQNERAVILRLEELVSAYGAIFELLVQLLYEVNDEITKFLLLRNLQDKNFQKYRRGFEKDKLTIENMITILGEAEKYCSVKFVTDVFDSYLRKDIRNMVFHKRYKIENGLIIEKDLSKPKGKLIVLTQKDVYDEFIRIITVFNCFFLNLYYQHLPRLMGSIEKLRVVANLEKEMNLE